MQREILPVERAIQHRRPEEHARHVLFGSCPFGVLRVEQGPCAP
ncbi:MAG: hypothetical protein OXC54_02150 [Rhodospirillaceae bacterium]|nr:hypothetical protein [Rhodospirillaceae bacterium]MCY4237142.1 hypothetical protein [Rhodospirillaceae bacterium]MCY4310107.1 hypothetical protein [Rhodospirillaceae bacterium]